MGQFAPSDNTPPMGIGNGPNPAPAADTAPTPNGNPQQPQMPALDQRIELTVGMSGAEYADLMDALQQAGLGNIAKLFHQAVNPQATTTPDPTQDQNSPSQLASEIEAMGAAQRR